MNSKSLQLALISLAAILIACTDPVSPVIIDSELKGILTSCEQDLENPAYEECALGKSPGQVEIWTWNLKFFPQDKSTARSVIDIIEFYQPDVIAFQEINNQNEMQELLSAMTLYEGFTVNLSGNLDVAFAYNTCRVVSLSEPVVILEEIWPRPPVSWSVSSNGFDYDVINIHLKCCDDGTEDRLEATEMLKEYISSKMEQPTVLLGDFNDEIDDSGILPFYQDSLNFKYADAHISLGSTDNYSYPSWPSDLDHILINKPLFSKLDTASTLILDRCIPTYSRSISDHRVVSAIFNF